MAKTQDRIALLLVALAIGGGFLAVHYHYTPAIGLVIAALGVFALGSGARMMVTRQASVPSGGQDINPRMELHSGFTAQIWGVLYLAFGVGLLAIAYMIWRPAGLQTFERAVQRMPALGGFIVMGIGALSVLWGTTRFAKKSTWSETRLPVADRWLQALSAFLTGSFLLAIGGLKTFAPSVLQSVVDFFARLAAGPR